MVIKILDVFEVLLGIFEKTKERSTELHFAKFQYQPLRMSQRIPPEDVSGTNPEGTLGEQYLKRFSGCAEVPYHMHTLFPCPRSKQ